MKVKLLKKLRRKGRNKIRIYSVTTERGTTIGMKIGYSDGNLFYFGLTEEEVLRRAEHIYIKKYILEKREIMKHRNKKLKI